MRGEGSNAGHLLYASGWEAIIVAAAILLSLPPDVFASESDTGDIRLLLLGDVGYYGSPVNTWLEEDLIIEYTHLPLAQGPPGFDAKRFAAIYVPRTLESMTDEYDMIVICEEEQLFAKWISTSQINVIYRAVLDRGLPLFNAAPNEEDEESHWANCVLSSLMPHDYTNFRRTNRFYQIRLVESGLPPVFTVFKDLGIEEYVGLWVRQLLPREGSTTWAWASPMSGHPFFISWQIGDQKATTSVVAQDLDEPWWGSDHRGASSGNPYGGDLLLNIIYWSVGRRPVEDIELVHAVRKAYEAFAQERRMILSLVDFIDKMGANGRPVEQGLDDIIPLRREARSLYVKEEYAQALGQMMMVKEAMKDLQALASRLCKRAMIWVYVVDWLAITGTSMVCVFLLWSLMVRRSMYREVGTTRTK